MHFEQPKSPDHSNFDPSYSTHVVHKYPEYPFSQNTGQGDISFMFWFKPPKQAFEFMHSNIFEEFWNYRQNPLSTSINDPPRHFAFFMHSKQSLAAISKVYFPIGHTSQIFPF